MVNMDRRSFLATVAAVPPYLRSGGRMDTAVSEQDIANQMDRAMTLKELDLSTGGGSAGAMHLAAAEANRAIDLMRRPCPIPSQPSRAESCALTFTNAAFMLHDAGLNDSAAHYLRHAKAAAKEAGSKPLNARICGQEARLRLAMGYLPDAEAWVRRGLFDLKNLLSPTERAMLYGLLARCHAAMNQPTETAIAIGQAFDHWTAAHPDDAEGRPWISFYDLAHLYGDVGAANYQLAKFGVPAAAQHAAENYERSANEHANNHHERIAATADRPDAARSAALVLMGQALALTHLDMDAAIVSAHRAMVVGGAVNSRRLTAHYSDMYDITRNSSAKGARALMEQLRPRVPSLPKLN